ncbi:MULTISPECIES: hypothetical protein [Methylosinus]|uniref:Major tropism determinant N-terminal domain-containing protein n=1 Tax=Methylosinus trichosporium (strain ATCC 35070 / NCIMB 11131 / UNIQEM 75 / OB3b) TaxID=595536 RepID=A0A2D2CYC4_METT3|nr:MULTISPECIES: hypothetical protein [Methylosinus]ATQ67726.1 hypothetical protein CQW49_07350 [Methylosinus trichosporium OB3b]OBS51166.1 hypothetical protein A8B73_17760 [Methylosinus sp. 3S-1]
MSARVKHRRGTATQNDAYVGGEGEITVDTTNNRIRLHDGVTTGGVAMAKLSDIASLLPQNTTSRAGALFALRGHDTGAINWLSAVADAVSPDEADPFNIVYSDPFWPPSSAVWAYVFSTLGAALGSFTGEQLVALQVEAAQLSPTRMATTLIRRGQALQALAAMGDLVTVQAAIAAASDADSAILYAEGYWPVGGEIWTIVQTILSLTDPQLADLQAAALAIP